MPLAAVPLEPGKNLSPLGIALAAAEDERGVQVGEAAVLCKVSRSAYHDWKTGTTPKIRHWPMISAFCNRTVGSIMLEVYGLHTDEEYTFGTIPGYLSSVTATIYPFPDAS